MRKLFFSDALVLILGLILSTSFLNAQTVYVINEKTTYVVATDYSPLPKGGDTVKILSGRTETLKFKYFNGDTNHPIVFINEGGQVIINTNAWGAIVFENCTHIKLSGAGDPNFHYGFKLSAGEGGLSFAEYSSDCEVEFVEIAGVEKTASNTNGTFFGIVAKKDFGGAPPIPYPIFNNLSIHDNYIHDVAEGMYIGETKSPGMEFHHVKIYNNVVINTGRESAQIANCIEDVEVYDNLFRDAGTENLAYQSNGFQIGANCVAHVYNNVIINAPSFGIIAMGNGDITLNNNFIQNNQGVFIDDRLDPIPNASLRIEGNYFDHINNNQIVENRNDFFNLFISNNMYNPDINFFNNAVASLGTVEITNNQYASIVDFQYTLNEGIFQNSSLNPEAYLSMGPQSIPEETVNLVSERIILTYDMITDLVKKGSKSSPLYLVNEQNLDPFLNQHPLSRSWIPAKNTRDSPFQTYIDLGEDYFIDYVYLHDMKNTDMLHISAGEPGNWNEITTYQTAKDKYWAKVDIKTQSRYLLLSMVNTIKAEINEIAIYGYAINPFKKSGQNIDSGSLTSYIIYPNPAKNRIQIKNKTEDQEMEVLNINGKVLLRTFDNNIEISHLPNGIYLLRLHNAEGIIFKGRFIKSE